MLLSTPIFLVQDKGYYVQDIFFFILLTSAVIQRLAFLHEKEVAQYFLIQ